MGTLVRAGIVLLSLSAAVHLWWFALRWRRGGRFDDTTMAMAKSPRRRWTPLQLEEGDIIAAIDLKLLLRLLAPARWALAVGVALIVIGLVV
jgi:hypothetical protein